MYGWIINLISKLLGSDNLVSKRINFLLFIYYNLIIPYQFVIFEIISEAKLSEKKAIVLKIIIQFQQLF